MTLHNVVQEYFEGKYLFSTVLGSGGYTKQKLTLVGASLSELVMCMSGPEVNDLNELLHRCREKCAKSLRHSDM